MDIVTAFAVQTPLILASILLGIAALLKLGKERGAILILLGAIGLLVMSLAMPVIYSGIMPKVMRNVDDVDNIRHVYLVVNSSVNVLWAGAFILIAIGTFMRSGGPGKPFAGQESLQAAQTAGPPPLRA